MKYTDLRAHREIAEKDFREEIAAMGVKKARLDDLCAGFSDGMTAMTHILRQSGDLKLEN